MKVFITLCLTAASSAVLLGSLPAAAQEYGYPDRCRMRLHHATYRCDRFARYGDDGPAYGGYPAYARPYAAPYGPPPYAPYGGYAYRGPHHAFYGDEGDGYEGGDADY